VEEVLYTDVQRDGMMTGVDLTTCALLADLGVRVIASGGVGSYADVRAAAQAAAGGISGLVIGKALLDGRLTLRDVLRHVQEAGSAC
jgi:phosphoribosylformimino-5-aminoimidazole carboxamide ribotide isomerase